MDNDDCTTSASIKTDNKTEYQEKPATDNSGCKDLDNHVVGGSGDQVETPERDENVNISQVAIEDGPRTSDTYNVTNEEDSADLLKFQACLNIYSTNDGTSEDFTLKWDDDTGDDDEMMEQTPVLLADLHSHTSTEPNLDHVLNSSKHIANHSLPIDDNPEVDADSTENIVDKVPKVSTENDNEEDLSDPLPSSKIVDESSEFNVDFEMDSNPYTDLSDTTKEVENFLGHSQLSSRLNNKEPMSIDTLLSNEITVIPKVTNSLGLLAESTMRVVYEEDQEEHEDWDDEEDGDDDQDDSKNSGGRSDARLFSKLCQKVMVINQETIESEIANDADDKYEKEGMGVDETNEDKTPEVETVVPKIVAMTSFTAAPPMEFNTVELSDTSEAEGKLEQPVLKDMLAKPPDRGLRHCSDRRRLEWLLERSPFMSQLTEAVLQQQCLWNPQHPDYRDFVLKDEAWRVVVEGVNLKNIKDVQTATMERKKLRDNHCAAFKRAKLGKNKLLPAQITTLKYSKPHMKYNITENNEAEPSTIFPSSEHDVSTTETEPVVVPPPEKTLKRIRMEHNYKINALNAFFNGICQSTIEMPHWMQTQVKKKIFDVIIEAEEELNTHREEFSIAQAWRDDEDVEKI